MRPDLFMGDTSPSCIGEHRFNERPEHDWSKWEDYSEAGITVMTIGPRVGQQINFRQDRQKRTCSKCAIRQDRTVREEVR